MTTQAFEIFLARLYTDTEALERFLHEPEAEARIAGLSEEEAEALARVDREALRAAARSFDRKRSTRRQDGPRSITGRLRRVFLARS